jgi:serine/threonine protein kinase
MTSTTQLLNSVDWNNIRAVVVGDIGGKEAIEVSRDLKAFCGYWRKPLVIAVIDSTDLDPLYELALAGVDAVLERPIHPNELSLKLRSLLEGANSDFDSPNRIWVGKTLGHFDLHWELGRGGMGIVYEAFDTIEKRRIALKILPPYVDLHSLLFFKREAQFLKKLKHRNVVQFGEEGRINDLYYLTLELVERPLDHELTVFGPYQEPHVRWILTELAMGLDYIHKSDVFHLDIKPSNVLFRDAHTPVIADFGLAQFRRDRTFMHSDTIVGTNGYIAPELAERNECDERSDLFSLGILAIELLTGKNPSGGGGFSSQFGRLKKAKYRKHPCFQKVSSQFAVILDSLLQFNPAHRTGSVTELLGQSSRCA